MARIVDIPVATTMLDSLVARIDYGGETAAELFFMDTDQATHVCVLTLSIPSFIVSSGSMTAGTIETGTCELAGTIGAYEIRDYLGNTVITGPVPGDITLNRYTVAINDQITITALQYSLTS